MVARALRIGAGRRCTRRPRGHSRRRSARPRFPGALVGAQVGAGARLVRATMARHPPRRVPPRRVRRGRRRRDGEGRRLDCIRRARSQLRGRGAGELRPRRRRGPAGHGAALARRPEVRIEAGLLAVQEARGREVHAGTGGLGRHQVVAKVLAFLGARVVQVRRPLPGDLQRRGPILLHGPPVFPGRVFRGRWDPRRARGAMGAGYRSWLPPRAFVGRLGAGRDVNEAPFRVGGLRRGRSKAVVR